MTDSSRDGAPAPVPAVERHKELYQLLHVRLHQLIDGKLPEHTAWDHCDFRIWADDLERLVSGYFEAALPHAPSPPLEPGRLAEVERLMALWSAGHPPGYVGSLAWEMLQTLWNELQHARAAHAPSPPTGWQLIKAERERQISKEGWAPEHDDGHECGELIQAAICYADHASPNDWENNPDWPWERSWWKPNGGPIRNLEKAGALIAAEIDRLIRAKTPLPAPVAPHEDTK